MRFPTLSATAIVTTSVLAWPAAADISPAEVWADWQRLIESSNATLQVGNEDASSDALTLTDVTIGADFPEDGGSFETTIPELVFENRGDGTVEIKMSAEYPIAILGKDEVTGEDFAVNIIARQPGMVTIASREDATTRYDYVGPEVQISVAQLTLDGDPIDVDVNLTLAGLKGAYSLIEGAPRLYNSNATVETVMMSGRGVDPDDPATAFEFSASVEDLATETAGTVVGMLGFSDMSAMVAEGFTTEWDISHGAAEYTISGADQSSRFNLKTTAEAGSFDGIISPDGLSYGGGNAGLSVAVSGSDIPFPQLTFSMAQSEGRLTLPVAPSEEVGDFGFLMRLIDLEISEALWGMFDPAGQLPRDPATLVLDLSGQARWLVDVFDPELAQTMSPGDIPGEFESVTLNRLALLIAGAELTGDGAFEIDNTPGGPFAPAPTPSGALNLQLTGGNTLLDTLVNMGLLPQEQAMGARMMLGLFARPGEGPDSLVSTIEVGKDGSVSANGQRIR
ncbi:MAG: DUF2125 domain-containing protein [Pseudomonadota bacterium]